MAKISMIQRDVKRKKMVKKFAAKRAELKKLTTNPNISDEERFEARLKLQRIPRNASPVRVRNRCAITGRSRGFLRDFGISRIMFRKLAQEGMIPGITKSSW